MDLIYVFNTSVCCYRYDPRLRARTQFIKDRRLYPDCWTRSERKHYFEARQAFEKRCNDLKLPFWDRPDWYEEVFDEIRAREPDKTLVEMRRSDVIARVIDERIQQDYYKKRGDRLLCLSFFHNDEDTMNLMWSCEGEELLEDKAAWIESYFIGYPYIKLVEIPCNFTLTEEYMRGLFEEYVLNNAK